MTNHEIVLTDELLEYLVGNGDGRWHDSEFRIDGSDLMKLLRDIEQAILAKQAAQSKPTKGWKLVPVNPTPDMLNAADNFRGKFYVWKDIWSAMLSAAPTTEALVQVGPCTCSDHECGQCMKPAAETQVEPQELTTNTLVNQNSANLSDKNTEAQVEPVAWEGGEDWESLAWALCAEEHGEDSCNELIWEGGPIPEPWGDRWLKYEPEAKRLIALVRKHTTPPASSALVEAAEKVSRVWAIEGDYVTAMNAAVTELRAALEAEKKGQV